ncbi:hypothetical protein GQ42DRAFT_91924 [Ramicandelaber brevisporus]|nr:hypothetical protein GQ42DRAFT_91924 [Ramicandelaber brevisporus]
MENTDYAPASAQPYLAKLATQGIKLANYNAVTHPSQPNYVAAIYGSWFGHVWFDFNANIDGDSLVTLLDRKGLSWKGYSEGYPGNCFLGATSGEFARKHQPLLSMTQVTANATRCANLVDFNQLDADVAAGALPTFSWITPNMLNCGHDTDVAYADKWLAGFLPKLLDKFGSDTLFVISFDENGNWLARNQVYTVLVGKGAAPGVVDSNAYDHYSLLRTIEDNFGLGNLGRNDADAKPFSSLN